MKYSVLIAEKRDGDEIIIDVNELNKFIDNACKEAYDEGYKAGRNAKWYDEYPWKVVPCWSDKTTPDWNKITCEPNTVTTLPKGYVTSTGTSVTMKLERDPENPFHIIGAHSV